MQLALLQLASQPNHVRRKEVVICSPVFLRPRLALLRKARLGWLWELETAGLFLCAVAHIY